MGEIRVNADESAITPKMKLEAEKRMSTARVQLLLNYPFFAHVSMNLQTILDEKVKGVTTNGSYIKYNPEYILKMNLDQTVSLLLKVIGHVTLLHPFRKGIREGEQFDVAASHAVNLMLQEAGLKLPDDSLKDDQYKEMTVERIYDLLPENPKLPKQKQQQSQSGYGNVDAASTGENGESVEEQEIDMKEKITAAANMAKQAGNLPAGLQRLISELLEPKVDWRQELAEFVTTASADDYDWRKQNTRMMHTGFFFPKLFSETIGDIYMFVDTSGSIGARELDSFAGELKSITDMFNKAIEVLYVDTEVAGRETIDPYEELQLHPAGGGGTMFSPGFVQLNKDNVQPACVVYFTDGYCDEYPKQHPEYPVLWCVWGSGLKGSFSPPFGKVLYVDDLL